MNIRKLESHEIGTFDDLPKDPKDWLALGAIEDGKVVGRLICVSVPHVECAWLDEDHRNGSTLYRMHEALTETMESLGASKLLAFAVDGVMGDYLARLGYSKLNWTVWEKEI